jgi:CTP:molybdopterin cytidylyltransferase MocA
MTPSFGMLTTYPPTQCGLATFAQALVTHLRSDGAGLLVPQGDAPAIAPTLLWPAVAAQYIGAGHALAMKRRESVA